VQRVGLLGLAGLLAAACAACGGGATHGAAPRHSAGRTLPAPLVQQIKAAVRQNSGIVGTSSATRADVYGPASHVSIEKAWSRGFVSESPHVSGAWYLIVLHGHFVCNCPVPPGAHVPHGGLALEVWSPQKVAGRGFGVANRLPAAVSRLEGPAVIDLG
jgi:hypothetical protein